MAPTSRRAKVILVSLVRFNVTVHTIRFFWWKGCVQKKVLAGNHNTKFSLGLTAPWTQGHFGPRVCTEMSCRGIAITRLNLLSSLECLINTNYIEAPKKRSRLQQTYKKKKLEKDKSVKTNKAAVPLCCTITVWASYSSLCPFRILLCIRIRVL